MCVFMCLRQRERCEASLHVCAQLCNFESDRTTLHAHHSITHTHRHTPAYLGSRFTFTHLFMPHFITLCLCFFDTLLPLIFSCLPFLLHVDFQLILTLYCSTTIYLFFSHFHFILLLRDVSQLIAFVFFFTRIKLN